MVIRASELAAFPTPTSVVVGTRSPKRGEYHPSTGFSSPRCADPAQLLGQEHRGVARLRGATAAPARVAVRPASTAVTSGPRWKASRTGRARRAGDGVEDREAAVSRVQGTVRVCRSVAVEPCVAGVMGGPGLHRLLAEISMGHVGVGMAAPEERPGLDRLARPVDLDGVVGQRGPEVGPPLPARRGSSTCPGRRARRPRRSAPPPRGRRRGHARRSRGSRAARRRIGTRSPARPPAACAAGTSRRRGSTREPHRPVVCMSGRADGTSAATADGGHAGGPLRPPRHAFPTRVAPSREAAPTDRLRVVEDEGPPLVPVALTRWPPGGVEHRRGRVEGPGRAGARCRRVERVTGRGASAAATRPSSVTKRW